MAGNAMPRERLFTLRETIARIEGKSVHAAREAAFNAEHASRADEVGGLDENGAEFSDLVGDMTMTGSSFLEVRSGRLADAGTASGFALALALSRNGHDAQSRRRLLMIAGPYVVREAGMAYAPGLFDFGAGFGEVVHAMPQRIEDALWLADTALSCKAFSAVILEVDGNPKKLGLTESRRFSLKTRDFGSCLILLRQGGEEEASSAATRVKVAPAPSAARIFAGMPIPAANSIGNPVFRVSVEKSRTATSSDFLLEWNRHDRRLLTLACPSDQRSPYPVTQFSAPSNGQDRLQEMGALLAFDRAS